jgi:hypothetical protein
MHLYYKLSGHRLAMAGELMSLDADVEGGIMISGVCYLNIGRRTKRVRGKRKKNQQKKELSRETSGASQQYGGEATTNPHLKALILEVVENQLRANDPPETRQTFERLLAAGYSRRQAVEMIGSAVVEEIWTVLHERKPFDRARFKASLEKLDV